MGAGPRLTALLLALPAAACSGRPPSVVTTTFTRDTLVTLRVGDEVPVGDQRSIRFAAVAEDSRCPADVRCVWAGDARALFLLSRGGSVELHTGVEPRSATIDGDTVTLRAVHPEPRAGTSIPQASYSVDLLLK
jgi:hypothetical protein